MSITQKTFDSLLQFKDAGLVASSAAAEVDSSAQILDLGSGIVHGDVVIDVTALEIASNDELFDIVVQLSPDSDFGTAGNIIDVASLTLGAKEAMRTDSDRDSVIGRYLLGFRNEASLAGVPTVFRYARIYTVVAGTIATGINFSAYLAKQQPGA